MAAWFFTSLMSGSAVTALDCLFTSAVAEPVWLDFRTFLTTWAFYTAAAMIGVALLLGMSRFLPRPLRLPGDSLGRMRSGLARTWLLFAILHFALVWKDLQPGSWIMAYAVVALAVGAMVRLFPALLIRRAAALPGRALVFSLVLVLAVNAVWLAHDRQAGALVRQRSADWQGPVPHVFLLVIDTARADHFSCYGYPFDTTPHIDRIAAEGLLCTQAYSASNWTPISHISIFTGKYPTQHANGNLPHMPESLLSLTEVLNRQGYFCSATYENPLAGRSVNLTQGFDWDFGVIHDVWVYPAPLRLWDEFVHNDDGAHATLATARRTFEWVERQGGHLFLYVNLAEPHTPYRINEPYFSRFTENLDWDRVHSINEVLKFCATQSLIIRDSSAFAGWTRESLALLRAAYDSELAYDDYQIGKLAADLQRRGLWDQTFFILTSDHGEVLGRHASLGHEYLLSNPALQIPMIFRNPAALPPRVTPDFASNVDVLPTVLSLMGLEGYIPPEVEGVNLAGPAPAPDRPLFIANLHQGDQYSLITREHKLIVDYGDPQGRIRTADTLLFDLSMDRKELKDLYDLRPGLRDSLLVCLNGWIERTWIEPEDRLQVSAEALAGMKALGYVH
ncbi:MAG: hypothetical protein C4524_04795 [Candidatus Zixiibacteriota bacterium]|nr:MAG: hypothetical protein C4524_04795 [candidate division Zixibacteria bacterium]